MSRPITIVGAGLTGLIAAHAFPAATVMESRSEHDAAVHEHSALLRFRSDIISRITGIPFRSVNVNKSIVVDGEHVNINMRLANMYAAKVQEGTGGKITGRSIWNMEHAKRFVAPNDFIARMRDQVGNRIKYDSPANLNRWKDESDLLISTAPLHVALAANSIGTIHAVFSAAPIWVERYLLEGVDLFQTIYYPGQETSTYRASITGNVLIIESMMGGSSLQPRDALSHFGLPHWVSFSLEDGKEQRYGKISEIDSASRRAFLRQLTEDHGIYSLGRFATWRNVLLDDVANDIEVIRRMIGADSYGRRVLSIKPPAYWECPF